MAPSDEPLPYLSPSWIEAADALLRSVKLDPPAPDPGLRIEAIVDDAQQGFDGYVIVLQGASMRARPRNSRATGEGIDPPLPSVRFSQSYAVAAAVARGDLSAQAAFLDADISLGGDVSALIGNSGLVARIGDALGSLRDRTVFDGDRSGAE